MHLYHPYCRCSWSTEFDPNQDLTTRASVRCIVDGFLHYIILQNPFTHNRPQHSYVGRTRLQFHAPVRPGVLVFRFVLAVNRHRSYRLSGQSPPGHTSVTSHSSEFSKFSLYIVLPQQNTVSFCLRLSFLFLFFSPFYLL